MDKIFLIIKREYSTRIRKKSFLIMTLFGPLVMLSMMVVPYWMTGEQSSKINLLINDETGKLQLPKSSIDYLHFTTTTIPKEAFEEITKEKDYQAYINIPTNPYSKKISIKHGNAIGGVDIELIQLAINQALLCRSSLNYTIDRLEEKENTINTTKMFMALIGAISIYFFIFLYGIQVMKGVIEEKNNRIIEVMVSSVKPFQLMIGKILGMALLALTQFGIWLVVFIAGYSLIYNQFGLENFKHASAIQKVTEAGTMSMENAIGMHEFVSTMAEINIPLVLGGFIFFFLMGYLIYGALFAIIGAASDVDTETQQFIMPITVPLLSTMVYVSQMFSDPHSSLSKFLSYFPLTSPLAMTARLPFANSESGFGLQLALSILLALTGFVGIVYIASRIYRIGILSYGSKVSYKDLIKWFFIKE